MLLCGVVFLCYWPALRGGLLWDDPAHVTRPDLRSWAGLIRIWTDVQATQQFYPVLHSAFWLEHKLWGDATIGYHLTNIVLHAACSWMLGILLGHLWSTRSSLTNFREGAARVMPPGIHWLVALIFAVHPVCVESVAWITEQKNTLSLLFYLVAGWTYLHFAVHRRPRTYWLAFAVFALALGTKTVTATLPAALLVVFWWKHGRLEWRRDVVPLLPWFALGLVAGLFTAWVERNLVGAEGAAFELTLLERVLLAGRVIWFYAGKLLWPADLAFFYPRWDVPAQALGWTGYLVAAIGVTVVLWVLRRRTRGLLAGWLLFVGSLFPALGFFNVYPFAFSYVADHFQYHASVSFIATTVGALALLVSRGGSWLPRAALAATGGIAVWLGVLSFRESRLYCDNETLFRTTVERVPDSWMAHHILAVTLAKTPGREAESIPHYEAAIRLNPAHPDAYLGLGVEMVRHFGRRAEAISLYRRALELRPHYVEAHNNLAVELAADPATVAEAIVHFQAVLRLTPRHAGAHVNLAQALSGMRDRLAEAVAHYEAALRIRPDDARAHKGLAYLLARIPERLPEAIAHGEAAVAAQPQDAEAHYHLANALAAVPERMADAISHYETALRLTPGMPLAHYGLANTLARSPLRQAEAIAHYERALQGKPDFLEARINLANVLVSIDERRSDGVAHYRAALRINPNLAWVHHNLALALAHDPTQLAEAFRHCEEAIRLQPDYLEAYNSLAILQAQSGDVDGARATWHRALQINPNFEPARKNLQLLDQQSPP